MLFAIAAIGIPTPNKSVDATDDDYPCRHRACGCRSAIECWTTCGCFTPAQRVAWALARGLPIPTYAILPSPTVMRELLARYHSGSTDGMAPVVDEHQCCCCQDESCAVGVKPISNHSSAPSTAEQADDGDGAALALAVFARRCQGQHWNLTQLTPYALAAIPVEFRQCFLAYLHAISPPAWRGERSAPPLPPPR